MKNQKGTALVLSLVMLIVLTLMGLSSIQMTSSNTHITKNVQDRHIAFQIAESAIREAESKLIPPDGSAPDISEADFPNTALGLYNVGSVPQGTYDSFVAANGINANFETTDALNTAPDGSGASAQYIIEYDSTPPIAFLITARARGVSPNTVVVLQSRIGE